jgi:hypothetical protein
MARGKKTNKPLVDKDGSKIEDRKTKRERIARNREKLKEHKKMIPLLLVSGNALSSQALLVLFRACRPCPAAPVCLALRICCCSSRCTLVYHRILSSVSALPTMMCLCCVCAQVTLPRVRALWSVACPPQGGVAVLVVIVPLIVIAIASAVNLQ